MIWLPEDVHEFFARERENPKTSFFARLGPQLLENKGLTPYLPYIAERMRNADLFSIDALMTEEEVEVSEQLDYSLQIFKGASSGLPHLEVWTTDRAVAEAAPLIVPGVGSVILSGRAANDMYVVKIKDGVSWIFTSMVQGLAVVPVRP